ncbi:MAG: hypothetical protein AB7P02_16480 [Alphaproteobacteria bacterium]
MSGRGIILFASGRSYVAEAVQAAERSAAINPLPHLVLCSEPPATSTRVAHRVVAVGRNPYLDKIAAMAASPFEDTIYLDTDCLVLRPIVDLLDLLGPYALAAAHAPGYRGFLDPEVPRAFFEVNTGVVAYRMTPATRDLFAAWADTYAAWLADPPFAGADGRLGGQDQPAFRRCLWRSGLPAYMVGPEYNYRAGFPGFACHEVRVLHGRVPLPAAAERHVNGRRGPRVMTPVDEDRP